MTSDVDAQELKTNHHITFFSIFTYAEECNSEWEKPVLTKV